MDSEETVLFFEHVQDNGDVIAEAVLNAAKRLNSLDTPMVVNLRSKLLSWIEDENVACVILRGAGEKSFCAGGDIKAARASAIANPGGPCEEAEKFFKIEYALDYLIHTYPKPLICFGHGYVMGGGMGLFQGAKYRVLEEKALQAMPEITIGLFTDVGAGYYYNQMTHDIGLYLGLTGAILNSADAKLLNLADYFYQQSQYEQIFVALLKLNFRGSGPESDVLIKGVLKSFQPDLTGIESEVERHLDDIQNCLRRDELATIVENILATTHTPWLEKCASNLKAGSSIAAVNIYHHLKRCKDMELEEIFQADFWLSTNCVRHPEFSEGVRALLVDKDKQPQWLYASVEEVPEELRVQMMSEPS